MKKLLVLFVLISNLIMAQAVKRAGAPTSVTLNEILRLTIDTDKNETTFGVASSTKWTLKLGSEDSSKVTYEMVNVGNKIPEANFNNLCTLCNYPAIIITSKDNDSNAGGMEDNKYRIIWAPNSTLDKQIDVIMELDSVN